MAEKRSRYRAFERFLTIILFIALTMFALYLLSAAFGWPVMKITAAVMSLLLTPYGLWNLYVSKELLKARSLWLTCAFGSIFVLTIVSLLCNFPRP